MYIPRYSIVKAIVVGALIHGCANHASCSSVECMSEETPLLTMCKLVLTTWWAAERPEPFTCRRRVES